MARFDPKYSTAIYWRDCAEESRLLADWMRDPRAKSAMLRVAHDYEKIADHYEAIAKGGSSESG